MNRRILAIICTVLLSISSIAGISMASEIEENENMNSEISIETAEEVVIETPEETPEET
ncbi:MAG: hypothetical protein HUJ70_13955 [Pseudobutyrivibrio sp.]|nr:hypothetical protein [Pseudobutyrivibrio sp.]